MESESLERTLDGRRPGGRPICARTRAKAPTVRKPGKAHAFKQVAASVSPLLNSGRHAVVATSVVATLSANMEIRLANGPDPTCPTAHSVWRCLYRTTSHTIVTPVALFRPCIRAVRTPRSGPLSVASLAHDPALKGDDITAVSRLHNSRPTAAVQQQPSNSRPNAVGVNSGAAR
jgi:hypothetical protein